MESAATGTARVKRGMAEMLKGGVIMDVVTPEQARIAEGAGAVAVMALERVPADIRAQGAPIGMLSPDGPTHGLEMAMGLPLTAPHPNAARLYVNWKLGHDASLLLCKIGGIPNGPAPAGVPCPTMSPSHVGSNDMITPEQQRDVLTAYGIKP